jgi:hypothetical protein
LNSKIVSALSLVTSSVIFLIFAGFNIITWSNGKIVQSDILAKPSVLKNISDDNLTLLIGIWLALIVFGGYLLTHIHFRVLKKEAK